MGAQTWEDVKGDVKAFCLAGGVVILAAAGVVMVGWPEIVLAAFAG